MRFFVAHPSLSPRHHGPIIDFLHEQKFVASVPNPLADESGQPPLVPPQPHLSMKGRTPESLLRAVSGWHRDLAEMRSAATAAATWGPSGFAPFAHEEGEEDGRRAYEVVELLTAQELLEEGRVMNHCVASYANACASGRSSIWSLRKRIESGRVVRLATVEVRSGGRHDRPGEEAIEQAGDEAGVVGAGAVGGRGRAEARVLVRGLTCRSRLIGIVAGFGLTWMGSATCLRAARLCRGSSYFPPAESPSPASLSNTSLSPPGSCGAASCGWERRTPRRVPRPAPAGGDLADAGKRDADETEAAAVPLRLDEQVARNPATASVVEAVGSTAIFEATRPVLHHRGSLAA